MEWLLSIGYIGLFLGSFLAATIVPFSADVLLIGMLAGGGNPYIAIIVATIGNFLGGLTSYWVGRAGQWSWIERLGVSHERMEAQRTKISRWGAPIALLTWVPFIGDIFAVALGFYRVRFIPMSIWMFIGKCGRFVGWALIYYAVV